MLEYSVAMAAIDEVHASVALIDILQRHPARDPAIEQVASPVAFVLVPVGLRPVARRLGEELVVPELDLLLHQGGGERDHPVTEARFGNCGPCARGRSLHDLELALLAALALLPRPIEREAMRIAQNLLAAVTDLRQLRGVDGVGNHQPSVLLEGRNLALGCFWITHAFATVHASLSKPEATSMAGSHRLDAREIQQLEEDGFVLREDVFDADEVRAIAGDCEALIAD